MNMKFIRMWAICLSVCMSVALLSSWSVLPPERSKESAGTEEAFFRELRSLVHGGTGGISSKRTGDAEERAACRVLAWSEEPLNTSKLPVPEQMLVNQSFYVFQYKDAGSANTARKLLTNLGIPSSLDSTWSASDVVSTSVVTGKRASSYMSWGPEYIGLDQFSSHWSNLFQRKTTVAILDTGISANHPLVAGRVVGQINLSGASDTVDDRNGHGTFVAGIISDAVGDAPVRFVSCKILDDDGYGLLSEMVAGFQYAAGRANVINLSVGADGCDWTGELIHAAIRQAAAQGTTVVVAAGNDGKRIAGGYAPCPAHIADDTAIVVGSVNRNGKRSSFSNWGSSVDLYVPGEDILSSVPGGGYERWAGTSMSAPLVSACAALLYCADGEDLTPSEVEAALKSCASSDGRLNMAKLTPEAEPAPAPDKPQEPEPGNGRVVNRPITYLGGQGTYTGGWRNGAPDGDGTLYFTSGSMKYYSGVWKDGDFYLGTGAEELPSGAVYDGGYARISQSAGTFSIVWDGAGIIAFPNGSYSEVTYKRGTLVRTIFHSVDGTVSRF